MLGLLVLIRCWSLSVELPVGRQAVVEQSEKKFDQAIEKFMLVHLEDYTNDQVIKKVIQYLGAEHEEQAKKILNKFKKQMEL